MRKAADALALFSNALQIKKDIAFVDTALRECSRLVACNCVQQAHAIETLRGRQLEVRVVSGGPGPEGSKKRSRSGSRHSLVN